MKKTLIALLALASLSYSAELVVDLKLDGNLNDSKNNLTFGDEEPMTWVTTGNENVTGSSGYLSAGNGKAAWNGSFVTAPSSTDFAITFFVNVGELPVFNNQANTQEAWTSSWILGGNTGYGNNNLKIGVGTTGQVKVDVKNKFSLSSGSDYTLDTNAWYQVGLSVTTSATQQGMYDYTIYIDGQAAATDTRDSSVSWSKCSLFEGSDYVANNKRFTGLVDDFQIYNVTSAADAAAVMSQQASRIIPEPATATLSLLALAGLAARRRRR